MKTTFFGKEIKTTINRPGQTIISKLWYKFGLYILISNETNKLKLELKRKNILKRYNIDLEKQSLESIIIEKIEK
jgi:hypothetical protein